VYKSCSGSERRSVCEALGKCHTKTMQQRRVHKMESLKEERAGGTGHIAINDESTVRILPNRSTFHSFSICSVAIPTLVWMLPQLIPPHCTKDIRTIPQNGEVAIIVIFHGLNDIIKFQLLVIMSRSCCTCAPIVSLPFF